MSITEVFLIACFLFVQAFAVFSVFWAQRFVSFLKGNANRIIIFICIQLCCLSLILLGGFLENQKRIYTQIRTPIDEHRAYFPESLSIEGDPTLAHALERQIPLLPRPDFSNIITLVDWQKKLRESMLELFGMTYIGMPIQPSYKIINSTKIDNKITRLFLTYTSYDNTSIPSYLFIPSSPKPLAAVLVIPGHVGEYYSGINDTAGLVQSYQHGAALELAKAGFVTLTMELRGFGYLGRKCDTEHKLVAWNAIAQGSFYKAIICRDINYAYELLRNHSSVKQDSIGITGVSYGGELAITYAALDKRIKAVVFQGFGGTTGIQQPTTGKDTEQPHYCHIIPGHNKILLQEDFYYLIAPRAVLGIRGNQEFSAYDRSKCQKPYLCTDLESPYLSDNIGAFSSIAAKAHEALRASSSFSFILLPGGHEYFVNPAIDFFKTFLLSS